MFKRSSLVDYKVRRLCAGGLVALALSCARRLEEAPQACTNSLQCVAPLICIDEICARDVSTDAGAVGANDVGPRFDDAGPCLTVSASASLVQLPIDIIITIDNSGSMEDEAAQILANVNNFVHIIGSSGLDYRVVLVSSEAGRSGVCVPAPLGSGRPLCGSGPEGRLLAIHQQVESNDSADLVLNLYPEYRTFLRRDAAKVFLWITDDESMLSADRIRERLQLAAAARDPGMFDHVIHNAIVGYFGDAPNRWGNKAAGRCDTLAEVGSVYLQLANCLHADGSRVDDCTVGTQARVCEPDWNDTFERIAESVLKAVPVQCSFDVPAPPDGSVVDPEATGVFYTDPTGQELRLVPVANEDECVADGWYFDGRGAPRYISLCAAGCEVIQRDRTARIDVRFGCSALLY